MIAKFRVRSRHVAGLACAMTLMAAGQPHAQDRQTGIYLEVPGKTGDEALARIESTMMQNETKGMMTAALTGGMTGVETAGVLEGAAAPTRAAGGAVSFQFWFAPKNQRTPKMPTNLDDALANTWDTSSMPPTANSPKDFSLIRVDVKDDARRASLGKAGGMMGGRGKPKGLIEVTIEEIAPNTYRVKPKAPLAPGEYVFVYSEQGGGFVWDFGVDGK